MPYNEALSSIYCKYVFECLGLEIMAMCLPPSIIIQHPFMLTILDRNDNVPLFLGKILKPTAVGNAN